MQYLIFLLLSVPKPQVQMLEKQINHQEILWGMQQLVPNLNPLMMLALNS